MLKKVFFILSLIYAFAGSAQTDKSAAIEARAAGGKEQVEQVLETQLTLPKSILTSGFEKDITIFFELNASGSAINLKFEGGLNNLLRIEMERMFRFLKFNKIEGYLDETQSYFLTFKLSTDKYSRYFKQKSKYNLKKGVVADSSYIIYTKADKSPEYFRKGDDGLAEFILSEIEYPKLAIEKSIEGTVVIEFVVETNGFVTGLVPKQTISGGCTDEAIRLVRLTKWQPAVLNNKLVRYKTTYPITFSLRNVNKEGGTSTIGN
jgi:TonB family protein